MFGFEMCIRDRGISLPSFFFATLLKRTPSSYLGSCRFKLPNPATDERPFVQLFELFAKYCICLLYTSPIGTMPLAMPPGRLLPAGLMLRLLPAFPTTWRSTPPA